MASFSIPILTYTYIYNALIVKTSEKHGSKKLQEMRDFPLYFSLILWNGFDIDVLHKHGYDELFKWFIGNQEQAEIAFGWGGNTSHKTVTGLNKHFVCTFKQNFLFSIRHC